MDKIELARINGKKINFEKLEEIEESEHVIDVVNLGYSGNYPSYIWFNIIVNDNSHNFEVDVYVKEGIENE